MYTKQRGTSLGIVMHITLVIVIAHYCAALPAPGPEEGGRGNRASNDSMFLESKVMHVFLLEIQSRCLRFVCVTLPHAVVV